MKKIIWIMLFILLLVGCKEEQKEHNENIVDFVISSPIENQIQYIDEFRLDKIWLDVTYKDHKEQMILNESMICRDDLSKLNHPGEYKINISLGNVTKEMFIVLYGSSSDKYYCIDIGEETRMVKARSVYELKVPEKSNQYFAGWFIDEELTKPYAGEEVYNLYAKYSINKTHRVRFYHENIIIKEEYVYDGKSANPPIMKSYNDYTFSHWDKEFNNIVEDTDIYAVYKQNYFEVKFYDINNNVISRQVIENGGNALPPTLDEVDGKVFVGWNTEYNFISKPTNIYPIYSNKQEYYRVRFYRDAFDDANFMYEEYVEKGGSISSVNYEIKNYELINISQSLTDINQDLNVICTYQIIENSFYVNNVLYTKLPCDQEFPSVPYQGYWKKSEDFVNRFDLVQEEKKIDLVVGDQVENVNLDTFLSRNPHYYIGLKNGEYVFYEWYFDGSYTRKIDDFSHLYFLECNKIYGKKVDLIEYDISKFNMSLITINNIRGYKFSLKYKGNNNLVFIPNDYNGLPVISIDYRFLDFGEYVFIGKNVIDIFNNANTEEAYYSKKIIVHESNPVYYDIDGVLYEKHDYKDKLIRFPAQKKNEDFTIPENIVLIENCFNGVSFNKLVLSKGCEFEGDTRFKSINNLVVSYTVSQMILAPNRQCGSIGSISFEPNSSLLYFESNALMSLKNQITLPYSVRFLEQRTEEQAVMCYYDNMIIPNNHNYFKVIDNMILDQTGTILIGLYRNKEYETFIVPDYIKALFYGCFFDTKIKTLLLPEGIKIVDEYNGMKSKVSTNYLIPFVNRNEYVQDIFYTKDGNITKEYIINNDVVEDDSIIPVKVDYEYYPSGTIMFKVEYYNQADNKKDH